MILQCRRLVVPISLILFCTYVMSGIIYGQGQHSLRNQAKANAAFRYAIVDNSVSDADNPELARRSVDILLDKRAFSEGNLRKLLFLVSKRFPEPALLYVNVYTDLEQILTPEERDVGVLSERNDRSIRTNYWAVYVRNDPYEFFNYSPVNDKSGIKHVVIKHN